MWSTVLLHAVVARLAAKLDIYVANIDDDTVQLSTIPISLKQCLHSLLNSAFQHARYEYLFIDDVICVSFNEKTDRVRSSLLEPLRR